MTDSNTLFGMKSMFIRGTDLVPVKLWGSIFLLVALFTLAETGAHKHALAQDPIVSANSDYRLGSGDKLRVIVFGEEDLSGEFEVSSTGSVSLPLIGQVNAANRTLSEFEVAIGDRLRDGYLIDPRISVDVINYRPFYIFGEVEQGGEYPYVSGMTVLNAVAVAGGYSYRANKKRVYITHQGASEELEYPAGQKTLVMPGDVIRVSERFF